MVDSFKAFGLACYRLESMNEAIQEPRAAALAPFAHSPRLLICKIGQVHDYRMCLSSWPGALTQSFTHKGGHAVETAEIGYQCDSGAAWRRQGETFCSAPV